jgi:ubiquinone/menaquinone biosynthesis C-methylase UbiE
MPALHEAAFDKIAPTYDALWSETPIGKAQRSAVWKRIDPLFKRGDLVLDLGCGTGVDASHLQSRGVSMYGIDSSPRMVEIARGRGIEAHCCPIERLEYFDLRLDGVISNFGALNCLKSLRRLAESLARMVRVGGYLALCFLNRICLWEIIFYLSRGKPTKAFRRIKGRAKSSLNGDVFYSSSHTIVSTFERRFRLLNSYGVGISVPPSYVPLLSPEVNRLALLDDRLAANPICRRFADHRLYIFERL